MPICIPDVPIKAEVADVRRIMDAADWEDGRSTWSAIGAGEAQPAIAAEQRRGARSASACSAR